MKKIMLNILFLTTGFSITAQNTYESILQQIEANSTTLAILRKQIEAQKIGNQTGILPVNPEVEFHYLWGNKSTSGNRTDITVKQSFDFPTVYKHRTKVANLQNENLELAYKAERIKLLLSAKQTCIRLIYYNALSEEYVLRLKNAERITATYKSKLEKGDANALETNKATMNLTIVKSEMARIETEQIALLSDLKRLNGGKDIAFPASRYPLKALPSDFQSWYTANELKNPTLQYADKQFEIDNRNVKLNQAMNLPKFSAGYMSEQSMGDGFRGITLGISVPLWENKNRVKQAKAQVYATQSALEDNKTQLYNQLQSLYTKARSLQANAQELRRSLSINSNESLLKRALDTGEISLLNYLMEVGYYYEIVDKVLEAERDYELSLAELLAMEL